ncbi:MAG TPA: hypothetical protein VK668_20240 [Mucilaginibacter sp.]|nr:hypothetical protein [Mucilaginibacter sp.]
MYAFTTSCSVALFLIVLLLLIFWKHINELLKDDSTQKLPDRTYSLSRTILFYWTLIIVISVCYIGIVSDNLPKIDSGVLILMGIVVGTTTTGRVIDNTQQQDPAIKTLIQNDKTQGFLTDILSDGKGLSVSRFQTVLFNIIYGCGFLAIVVSQNVLYDFPKETLTLLGISSGAYALLKIPENK